MKINKIKCDVCGKETDGIVDAKNRSGLMTVDGKGNIISSTEPTYITINLKGHGTRVRLNREYDICEECLWNGIIIDQVDKCLRIYGRKELPKNER